MKTRRLLFIAVAMMLGAGANAQTRFSTLVKADSTIGTWDKGNLLNNNTVLTESEYILDVIAYVADGQTITIPAGTVIKAELGTPGEANSLVVCRGGKIYAEGTPEKPIIFTTVEDPLDGSYSATNRAKWGGIIILGNSYNNIQYGDPNPENALFPIGVSMGEGYIEGLQPPDIRNRYGAKAWIGTPQTGTPVFNEDDNSGVLRYVSVRHGGSKLGENNEINGITMGSVGRGTVVEFVEVVSNEDDGMEFFGGTVNVKHVNIMFCEDDQMDVDQGYKGKGQFIYCVQLPLTTGAVTTTLGDNGFEWDGNDVNGRDIVSNPHFSNVTVIGHAGSGDFGLELKEDMAGMVSNGIIAGFAITGRHYNNGTDVDTTKLESILFLNCAGGLTSFNSSYLSNVSQVTSTSIIDDVMAVNVSYNATLDIYQQTVTDKLNPVPDMGVAQIATTFKPWENDDFFEYAPYKGAFAPGTSPWTSGWTNHVEMGTDADALGLPSDVDKSGTVSIGDLTRVLNDYGKTR